MPDNPEPRSVIGWGDPSRRTGLPAHARRYLARTIGLPPSPPPPPTPPRPADLPASRLPPAVLADLPGDPDTSAAARLAHLGGASYLDLVRRRRGEPTGLPDAVVAPADAAEVAQVLAAAGRHGLAVLPYGGGTSVVGGLVPRAGDLAAGTPVLALDLRRMDRVLEIDQESLLARVQPGLTGPALEALLGARGLTLGHLPQSFEYATVGGFLATRSAGQNSTGFGRISDMLVELEMVTPAGTVRWGRGAASAAGPDLRALALGSEGAFGVITEAVLRVRRVPSGRRREAFMVRTWSEGLAALRELTQRDAAADIVRLSDPDETAVNLALAGTGLPARLYLRARGAGRGSLLVLGWEGQQDDARRRAALARRILSGHRAVRLGSGPAEAWAHSRFQAPYLRDDLLDAGVMVETLETSALWSGLPLVHEQVRQALTRTLAGHGTPPVVMCHVSHLYRHGASLYFTVLARQGADPVGQWSEAKAAASRVLMQRGATITHHHAVGRDHRDYLVEEIGPLGVEVLRAVKAVLDPQGVCNPGVLVAPEASG